MAQSAAAIVAIIAGFIITRVMALSTERGALESRLDESRQRLRFAETAVGDLEAQLKASDTDTFKRQALFRLTRRPSTFSPE